jgi:hypothetical protein
MNMARKVDSQLTPVTRLVSLKGIRPIMFDRYAGDNDTKLLWPQKVYLIPGTAQLALPAENVMSFLCSHNTNSAPKRLRDARKYKAIANACLSFVSISGLDELMPEYIPFLRDGRRIEMGEIDVPTGRDPLSGIYLHRSIARLPGGIPNPKERPVLPLPWSIYFSLTMIANNEIKEQEVRNLFEEGGVAIGLGTYRGVFGKFIITRWG